MCVCMESLGSKIYYSIVLLEATRYFNLFFDILILVFIFLCWSFYKSFVSFQSNPSIKNYYVLFFSI